MQQSTTSNKPKQSAPALRRKKNRGSGLCPLLLFNNKKGSSASNSNQVLNLILMVGGCMLLLSVGLIYEFSKSTIQLPKGIPGGARLAQLQQRFHQRKQQQQAAAAIVPAAGAGVQQKQQQQQHENKPPKPAPTLRKAGAVAADSAVVAAASSDTFSSASYLSPHVSVLPIFSDVPNGEFLASQTLDKSHPTVAGVTAILQRFLRELHISQVRLRNNNNNNNKHPQDKFWNEKRVIRNFFNLTEQYIAPLEHAYAGQTIFPVREDDSIFLSLAAYREHLLAQTMIFAFDHAKHPEKLVVGAVVQNCFGKVNDDGTIDTTGLPCKTGVQVVGHNEQGQPMTKVSDAPPDANGLQEFCSLPKYKKYCDNGQVRALYVHESESQGPAMARYYASRLWGGETYFLQCDSHLEFAKEWDFKYITELKATRNFPKSVLSSYPPGFSDAGPDGTVSESPGARLCSCETKSLDPNPILRLGVGRGYHGNEPRPTQIPFIAAGFFFARSEFLRDVPFDPYLPYCFMGEEIALSMRAWTKGWDIYAPRKNWIAHQYRPGRLGLPKFWESVNRLYRGTTSLNEIQHLQIQRIKHMVGYPSAQDLIIQEGMQDIMFADLNETLFGLGTVRSWQEYMDFADLKVDPVQKMIVCSRAIKWCNNGEKD